VPGQPVSTSFTIQATTQDGVSATDSTTSVVTTRTVIGSLTISQQLELIYLAYFNRSADSGGLAFWSGQDSQARGGGQSAAAALTNVANSFAPQPETVAIYGFLAPLVAGGTVDLSTAAARAGLNAFIGSVYQNLFGHAADPAGQAYWAGQVINGAVGLGAAALAIANGATGSDATELRNKVTVALDFTTRTAAAGLGTTTPLANSFVTAARSVLSGVDGVALNDASVTAAQAATTAYIAKPAGVQAAAPGSAAESETPLTISVSNSVIDPGAGDVSMAFLPGAGGDTLVLHANGVVRIQGFDPASDVLDVRSLLREANVDLAVEHGASAGYFTILDQGTDAMLRFDPAGHGGGGTIAVLQGLGSAITTVNDLAGATRTQGAILLT
jgi:hypothetical protein